MYHEPIINRMHLPLAVQLRVQCTCTCIPVHVCVYHLLYTLQCAVGYCLATKILKAHIHVCLEAEVVGGGHGMARVSRPTTANELIPRP